MQRKIWLTDANNLNRFDFTAFGDFIFTSPTSLGIYRQQEFLNIGNQRIKISDVPTFKSITGTIIIKGKYSELEAKYAKFRDFISANEKAGFRLYVQTQENVSARYIKCDIDTIDKTEKTTATIMLPISIQPKSLWLGDVASVSVEQSVSVPNAFSYTAQNIGGQTIYGFGYIERDEMYNEFGNQVYATAYGLGSISQVPVFNSGEEETPLRIRIYGEAINPLVLLKTKEGEVLQSVKFSNLTIDASHYLEINSDAEFARIELVDKATGARADVEDYADQDTNIFIRLPVGEYTLQTSDEVPTNAVTTRVDFPLQFKGA